MTNKPAACGGGNGYAEIEWDKCAVTNKPAACGGACRGKMALRRMAETAMPR